MGAHFRPPAKALIQALASDHPLELRPEPSNPYDPNAVAVWLDADTIDEETLETELAFTLLAQGQDVESLLAQRWWQLGYLAKDKAAILQEAIARAISGANADAESDQASGFPARLGFTGDGKPAVLFNI
jgi:hypothetical protein